MHGPAAVHLPGQGGLCPQRLCPSASAAHHSALCTVEVGSEDMLLLPLPCVSVGLQAQGPPSPSETHVSMLSSPCRRISLQIRDTVYPQRLAAQPFPYASFFLPGAGTQLIWLEQCSPACIWAGRVWALNVPWRTLHE